MTTYKVYVGKDLRMTFSGNFAQASSPLLLEGQSTPFQVADARHMVGRAASLLNRWCHNQGGAAWGDDEDFEIIYDEEVPLNDEEPCQWKTNGHF